MFTFKLHFVPKTTRFVTITDKTYDFKDKKQNVQTFYKSWKIPTKRKHFMVRNTTVHFVSKWDVLSVETTKRIILLTKNYDLTKRANTLQNVHGD